MHKDPRFNRTALAAALALALFAPLADASSYKEPPPVILGAPPGQALGHANAGSHAAAVGNVLRNRGASDATANSLVEVSAGISKLGRTHARLVQQVGGLTVYGASAKAAFTSNGDLVHVIAKLAAVPSTAPTPATIDERQALDAAMARVHPGVQVAVTPGNRFGQTQTFKGGAFFQSDPEVTRVVVPQADGTLAQGFLVETWTKAGNLLDHTLIGGDGAVLRVERRTAEDQYNVFVEDPLKGAQAIVPGPGAGNAQSPAGWLFAGAQNTIDISGNNVNAYLDASNNNQPDKGGAIITSGDFLTVVDLGQQPSTTDNKAVAVQNLFFHNNLIHDLLYANGFTEAFGNFQADNFGLGGVGRDAVKAEAQDGSGTNNANFATPPDGRPPRMQMYLWSALSASQEVVVQGTSYDARSADFGPALSSETGTIVLGVDGGGTSTADGCEPLTTNVRRMIVLIDRGTCTFAVKILNVQKAGASAMIVANNDQNNPDATIVMGGEPNGIHIPSVMVSYNAGQAIRNLVPVEGTIRQKANPPIGIDSALDADVIYHEYGHGLTWRMIGGMSGPISGALGEGASDTLAFLVNGDDRIGEYSNSSPFGIRRAPYAGYPASYSIVNGASVHNDGEIYAAAMWRVKELWADPVALLDHFVDGMNFTPASPTYENMRDGLLQSVELASGQNARWCHVWTAFAQFGIGVGSSATINANGTVTTTPSTSKPANCP